MYRMAVQQVQCGGPRARAVLPPGHDAKLQPDPQGHTSQLDFRREPSTGLSLKAAGWVAMGHVERFPKQLRLG